MHKLLRLAEANAGRTSPDPQDKVVDQIGPGMRKSNGLAGIRRSSSLSFHHCVGKFEVILHMAVVTEQFRYFQDRFCRGPLAHFEHDYFRIKDFGEQRRHLEETAGIDWIDGVIRVIELCRHPWQLKTNPPD